MRVRRGTGTGRIASHCRKVVISRGPQPPPPGGFGLCLSDGGHLLDLCTREVTGLSLHVHQVTFSHKQFWICPPPCDRQELLLLRSWLYPMRGTDVNNFFQQGFITNRDKFYTAISRTIQQPRKSHVARLTCRAPWCEC